MAVNNKTEEIGNYCIKVIGYTYMYIYICVYTIGYTYSDNKILTSINNVLA